MLKDKVSNVRIAGNVRYYENLGYIIPKHTDNRGRLSVKRGTYLEVNIEDIPEKSEEKINIICDYCKRGYISKIIYYYGGHKEINKDCCYDCRYKKIEEIYLLKYGTTSLKVRSKIMGFKIGRHCLDGNVVYQCFIDKGFKPKFKPEDYVRCKDKLPYICPKHKDKGILYTSYDSFKDSITGCNYCACEMRHDEQRYSYDFVKQKFTDKNYSLITKDYINVDQDLEFICLEHEEYGVQTTSLWSVLNYDNNCTKCRYVLQSGDLHYNWRDGGAGKERNLVRNKEIYKTWREGVVQRDNHTCQCCNSKINIIETHHLYNFAEYPDLRFDVNNGTTLCNKCHNFNQIGSFHHTYGAKNNTPEQLWEYIQRRNNG